MADETRLITVKRGTKIQWNNEITPLEAGELGYDITDRVYKGGDGSSQFSAISEFATMDDVGDLESGVTAALALKSPLASPSFTGVPTAPTATAGTSTEQIATTKFVKTAVDVGIASNDAMALRGTLGTGGTAASLPTEGYLVGWTYKVVSSGTYAGQACSIGDLMICVSSFNTAYKDADWSRVPISDEYSDYYLLEGDPA